MGICLYVFNIIVILYRQVKIKKKQQYPTILIDNQVVYLLFW